MVESFPRLIARSRWKRSKCHVGVIDDNDKQETIADLIDKVQMDSPVKLFNGFGREAPTMRLLG